MGKMTKEEFLVELEKFVSQDKLRFELVDNRYIRECSTHRCLVEAYNYLITNKYRPYWDVKLFNTLSELDDIIYIADTEPSFLVTGNSSYFNLRKQLLKACGLQ